MAKLITQKSSNLTIRLSSAERLEFEKRAKSAKMPLTSFARFLIRREVNTSTPEHDEIIARLVENVDSLTEFRNLFKTTSERLELAVLGSVASSAMLKDSGRLGEDEATALVISHIDEALDAAPGILRHRLKAAEGSDA